MKRMKQPGSRGSWAGAGPGSTHNTTRERTQPRGCTHTTTRERIQPCMARADTQTRPDSSPIKHLPALRARDTTPPQAAAAEPAAPGARGGEFQWVCLHGGRREGTEPVLQGNPGPAGQKSRLSPDASRTHPPAPTARSNTSPLSLHTLLTNISIRMSEFHTLRSRGCESTRMRSHSRHHTCLHTPDAHVLVSLSPFMPDSQFIFKSPFSHGIHKSFSALWRIQIVRPPRGSRLSRVPPMHGH